VVLLLWATLQWSSGWTTLTAEELLTVHSNSFVVWQFVRLIPHPDLKNSDHRKEISGVALLLWATLQWISGWITLTAEERLTVHSNLELGYVPVFRWLISCCSLEQSTPFLSKNENKKGNSEFELGHRVSSVTFYVPCLRQVSKRQSLEFRQNYFFSHAKQFPLCNLLTNTIWTTRRADKLVTYMSCTRSGVINITPFPGCDIKLQFICIMIRYILTAVGLTPGGSSTVHIYTQTIHRTTKSTQNNT
jgi:hypothetical protein